MMTSHQLYQNRLLIGSMSLKMNSSRGYKIHFLLNSLKISHVVIYILAVSAFLLSSLPDLNE